MADSRIQGESRLEQLRRELDAWRRQRKRPGQRIPEELWMSAARLAGDLGLRRVHKELRLQYTDLKRRVEGEVQPIRRKRVAPAAAPRPTFVELLEPTRQNLVECTLEVESRAGAHLRVTITKVTPNALTAMLRDFAR